jgi:5'-nucleotidase
MTGTGDVPDTEVAVKLGATTLGTAPVTTTVSSSPDNSANSNDDAGTAHVDVVVPAGTAAGAKTLTITGAATGTEVLVPITVASVTTPPPAPSASTTKATVKPKHPKAGQKVTLKVVVKAANGAAVTGQVKVKVDGKTKTVTLSNGKATVKLGKFGKGSHKVKVTYLGSSTVESSKDTVKFKVTK